MRALFFGTPDIAVPSLLALGRVAEIVGVVCQPDRPSGRGLAVQPPPVKRAAEQLGVPVVQPAKVRVPEFAAWVRAQEADVAVVLAYGRILVPEVLAAPRAGCINLHASLLPRWRGAAPITWSIVHGDAETGISLMQMDAGLDTGPVLAARAVPIAEDDTAGSLSVKLADLAAAMVADELPRAVAGELTATPQDGARATLAPLLTKDDGRVDWTAPARAVHDRARGMSPWPGAWTRVDGKLLKVLETARGSADHGGAAPGTIVVADKHGVLVACADGTIELRRAQLEGRKPLTGSELVAGRALRAGQVLG